MLGIKNLIKILTSSLEVIIFKALKIKSIKNKEIYMVGWYYGFLLALYSFYFIFKGKAELNHIIYAIYSVIVFLCLIIIGRKAGTKESNIITMENSKLTYYFHLKKDEAFKMAKLIQKGLGENIIEDENKLYMEIINILKSEQVTN